METGLEEKGEENRRVKYRGLKLGANFKASVSKCVYEGVYGECQSCLMALDVKDGNCH